MARKSRARSKNVRRRSRRTIRRRKIRGGGKLTVVTDYNLSSRNGEQVQIGLTNGNPDYSTNTYGIFIKGKDADAIASFALEKTVKVPKFATLVSSEFRNADNTNQTIFTYDDSVTMLPIDWSR